MTTHRTSPIIPAAQPPTPIADRVAALVQAHPGGIGRTDIARALGVKAETVGSALSRAVADGHVRRVGRGLYAPSETTTTTTTQEAAHAALSDPQPRAGIQIRLGRMGREEGLLLSSPDGYGEAFIPREALPDLRRRLARAQAKIEAR
ncbi:type IV toxin-antitoxin system AbiEi family antitoxin domain-containing protein [Kocuria palustris]|uniref:type IV toxin-antitoxin system AbiEi family antitoxin domain-containing protein n=1 Tax=Kocuria palustris TaxID=71999 RepID=UPI0006AA2935|nr:type IV toxin-antitoxin system AbiEi family antitoxin domain-containing protein [Kocuria palustris]ALB03000.1 hypothetical protein KPaMU14_04890 [Kocuria palustris]